MSEELDKISASGLLDLLIETSKNRIKEIEKSILFDRELFNLKMDVKIERNLFEAIIIACIYNFAKTLGLNHEISMNTIKESWDSL